MGWRLSDEILDEGQLDPCGERTGPSLGEGAEHILNAVGIAPVKFDPAMQLGLDGCHDTPVVAREVDVPACAGGSELTTAKQ
jgi:hypothetical protein